MKDKFKVFCLSKIDINSMYVHWAKGLTMYIYKDGVNIKLTSEEVQQVIKSLPKTIGGKY